MERRFWLDPAAEAIGVRFAAAILEGVTVARKSADLKRWRKKSLGEVREVVPEKDPILRAYHPLLRAAGQDSMDASPEYLLRLFHRSGTLPTINTVVDCYNVVSVTTRAVVSVHDLDRLKGPVRMVLLAEETPFKPLGSAEVETMLPGEFGVRDDHHMLCRLNCKQSRLSSVHDGSARLLIYVQGNPCLEGDDLSSALDQVCDSIRRFNGGSRVVMSSP